MGRLPQIRCVSDTGPFTDSGLSWCLPYLFCFSTTSAVLGRLPLLTEADCDVTLLPRSTGSPSKLVFFYEVSSEKLLMVLLLILRLSPLRQSSKLYAIMISALNRIYSGLTKISDVPNMHHVTDLANELFLWKQALPPFLKLENHPLRIGRQWLDLQTNVLSARHVVFLQRFATA
jgi:hypothetical protein